MAEGAEVDSSDHRGYNPVFAAAEFGHAAVIRELRASGADLTQGMAHVGWCPLFVAAWGGKAEAVSALLDCGVDGRAASCTTKAEHLGVEAGTTAMQVAIDQGHAAVASIFEARV